MPRAKGRFGKRRKKRIAVETAKSDVRCLKSACPIDSESARREELPSIGICNCHGQTSISMPARKFVHPLPARAGGDKFESRGPHGITAQTRRRTCLLFHVWPKAFFCRRIIRRCAGRIRRAGSGLTRDGGVTGPSSGCFQQDLHQLIVKRFHRCGRKQLSLLPAILGHHVEHEQERSLATPTDMWVARLTSGCRVSIAALVPAVFSSSARDTRAWFSRAEAAYLPGSGHKQNCPRRFSPGAGSE